MKLNNISFSSVQYNKEKAEPLQTEVQVSCVQQPETEYPAAPQAAVLKAYAGIKASDKQVSKDELFDYFREIGVKNEKRFDAMFDSLADKDGNVYQSAVSVLKDFQQKNHLIWDSLKIFDASKEDGKINYKALKLAAALIPESETHILYSHNDCIPAVLNGSKYKDGKFNDAVLTVLCKHAEELKQYFMFNPRNAFYALKNNDGEFCSAALDYLDKKLSSGVKVKEVMEELYCAKDAEGNFSYEINALDKDLMNFFDKYKAALVKKIALSLPDDKKQKSAFVELAKSLKDDEEFFEVWNFISDIKSDENDKSQLGYDRDSYNFVKGFLKSSYKGTKELGLILKKLNVPYHSLSAKDIETLYRMCSLINEEDIETYLDAATWKAGEKKGQFSTENLEKYLDIYSKNRMIMNAEDIKYLADCLSLEEDDKALSLFKKLHNLRWKKQTGNFETEEMLNKFTLNFVLSLACIEKEGKATRPCYPAVIENIGKLFDMELPMSSKDAFENFLVLQDLDVIEKLEKVNLSELGINTGQISQGVFKKATEYELLKFKDYMKKYLKGKNPKSVDINLNSNISSIVELTTGASYDKTKLLYDFKKGKPVTELKEYNWHDRISTTQKDFQRNTVSEQRFVIEKEGPYGIYAYKRLESQKFTKYDNDGNVIFTEVMEKSPAENIFNVTKTYADGRVENLCRAEKTKEGNDIIEKHLTSFDGTKTDYSYEDDPDGNRIIDYKITDKNGKVLMNQSVTFEVIDDNHFVSSRNNKKFDIQIKDGEIVVKNLQNNKTAVIDIENFTKSTQEKILPLLKQLPGEELFAMKELNLESFAVDERAKNAAFSPALNAIMFNDKYLDAGVALHEWGHGKDKLMFIEIDEEIYKDKELSRIYNEEKRAFRDNFSDAQLEHIGYFAADYHYLGSKAVKEGIAETNTLLSACPKNDVQSVRSHYWQQYFPRTIAYLAGLLN